MRIWELIKWCFGYGKHEDRTLVQRVEDTPLLEDWTLLKVNARKWDSVIWHHSSTKDGKKVDWEAIRRYHIDVKGWDDIGYHFGVEFVEDEVKVFVGRPLSKWGAHTVGMNECAVGVCVIGDYDKEKPHRKVLDVCIKLGKEINRNLGISVDRNFYHNQFAKKTCPGKKFPSVTDFKKKLGE